MVPTMETSPSTSVTPPSVTKMKQLMIGLIVVVTLLRMNLVSANDSISGGFTIQGNPPVIEEPVVEVSEIDGTTTIHPLTLVAASLTAVSAGVLVVTTWPSRYPKKRSYDHS